MSRVRAITQRICRALIGAMLFSQLAVAAYACPATGSSAGVAAAMPADCDQMDREAPNLCVEHCRFGQQSADTAAAPVVSATAPVLLYALPTTPEPAEAIDPRRRGGVSELAAPPPPHTVLHCVYRI